ncbi:MarR family winged helix-turn-helix transcriptional regulator [Pseudolysinimonas sp.]|uniref:MarR family winged helix-turn-helix transcriptional regulator n=1 Tax=Pseudolysinimonas sp. TaxID=2680009 RepID=UPI003F7F6D2F
MPSDANDPDELSQRLRTAVGRLYRRFRALRAHDELGDAALAVLSRVRKEGPQTLTALSGEARVTPSSMSQTVNRLTAGGYLVRAADPDDGRRVLFHLTESGRRVEGESVARSRAWFRAELVAATDHERAVLAEAAEILRRIADSPAPEDRA